MRPLVSLFRFILRANEFAVPKRLLGALKKNLWIILAVAAGTKCQN
jgi:hypothetical protein